MPLSPVLDLRHDMNNSMSGLRVTNARARGELGGYVVEAQRRQHQNLQGVAIRLSAPDGRVLDVMGAASPSNSSAKGPVYGALSPEVGLVFREHLSPASVARCVKSIEASIQMGHRLLDAGLSGDPARFMIQCAASDLDPDEAVQYRMEVERLTRQGIEMIPVKIRVLTANRFAPAVAVEWFRRNMSLYVPSADTVKKIAAFRDNGWTPAQYQDLSVALGDYPKNPWALLDPETAMLAARAGMSPQEALTMVTDGSWDADGVGLLVALRD